ncbi:hypothetical protein, partial [Burkholderia multivorans]|uniref:hypothetical protein n=1 Tax=Burkholderia multivorans TaxID=87883 RepID=UPI001C657966
MAPSLLGPQGRPDPAEAGRSPHVRTATLTLAEAGAEIAGTVHLASGETLDFTHRILATGMEADRPEIPG